MRGSRTVLREAGGETPPAYSPEIAEDITESYHGTISNIARLFRALPDAILCVDKDTRIIMLNPAMEKILGYREEELVGKLSIILLVPPGIMWKFMTGYFDLAVEKGMEEQGMTGSYSIVEADAEMLNTHGVDPKEKALSCSECHSNSGSTPDGAGMIPFDALGYHAVPAKVKSCTLRHEQKSMNWQSMHSEHRDEGLNCVSCHTFFCL